MNKIKILPFAFCLTSGIASAGVIPSGVQNDVAFSQVSDWGWSLCHSSSMGGFDVVTIADLFGSCSGDYLMLGSARVDSDSIDVLAAALWSDVTTLTAHNATTTANGAEWYYNGYSMGFAGLGDAILQNSADRSDMGERDPLTWERDRLSWHTNSQASSSPPVSVSWGYRSGNNVILYDNTDWNRLVFSYTAAPAESVPEPAAMLLFALGLTGLGLKRKKSVALSA